MATYIPGVTDMIPQVQPFVPDYNFYSQALQLKQSKYDTAREQLSTLYGSLLNAPLTRDDNTQTREQFFKAIDQDIQRMSGVDLSLNQNFEAAQSVFNQLLDNDYVVKDMVWTRNLHNQYQRADGFRNCTDPEKCGGSWWEGGERLLGYAAQDFKNATAEESMKMGNARFVPYQDITKKAIQLAKDADINMQIDQLTGQWITTTKNGPMIAGQLQSLLMGSIAQDPKVVEYYQAQSEVTRRDFIYGNQDQYGSAEAAEQAYINTVMPTLNQWLSGVPAKVEDEISSIEKRKQQLQEKAQNSAPYKQQKLAELYQEFVKLQGGMQQTLDYTNDVAGELQVGQNNQRYTGGQVDRMMAALTLGNDINKMAEVLSYRNYEFSIKENPFAVQAAAFRNSMLLEEAKFQHELQKMEAEYALQDSYGVLGGSGSGSGGGKRMESMYGDPASNTPTKVIIKGGFAFGGEDKESEEYRERAWHAGFAKDREASVNDISSDERKLVSLAMETAYQEAKGGNEQAKLDYINMVKDVALTEGTHEKRLVQEGEENLAGGENSLIAFANRMKSRFSKSYAEDFIRQAENLPIDKRYELAKKYMDNTPLNNLGATRVSAIYANLADGIMDPSKKDAVMHDYLQPILDGTFEARKRIEDKNLALQQMDQWHAGKIKEVANAARQNPKYGQFVGDAIEAYYDTEGYIVDKKTFIQNMVNKNPEYGYESKVRYLEAMYEGKPIQLERGEYIDEDTKEIKYGNGVYAGDVLADAGEFALGTVADVATLFGVGYLLGGGSKWVGDWNPEVQTPKSISDLYQEAFTDAYLKFKDNPGWAGLMGAGDEAAYGQNFKNVDVVSQRSVGTMGFLSYMQDALANGNTRFSLGDFADKLPDNDPEAQKLMNVIYNDFKSMYKDENRPILDITYADIAGSDANTIGMNIKLNQDYINKYKGTEKEKGLMADYMETLLTEGLTIYTQRQGAQNLFTAGMAKSPLERLMDVTGEIKMDTYPEYFQNFSIKYDPAVGGYTASGMWRNGLTQDGQPNWDYHSANYSINRSLDDLVTFYNQLLTETARSNKDFEQLYVMNSKQNQQQYGG